MERLRIDVWKHEATSTPQSQLEGSLAESSWARIASAGGEDWFVLIIAWLNALFPLIYGFFQ